MSEQTVYSQAAMSDGISALYNAQKTLASLLEELIGQLNASLGMWEDNARNTYQEVQNQWNASADRQQQIVQRMPVLLTQINDGYNATEAKNAGIWS